MGRSCKCLPLVLISGPADVRSHPLSPQDPSRYGQASTEYTGHAPEPLAGSYMGAQTRFWGNDYPATPPELTRPRRSPGASFRSTAFTPRGRQDATYQNLSDQDPWRPSSPIDGQTRAPVLYAQLQAATARLIFSSTPVAQSSIR